MTALEPGDIMRATQPIYLIGSAFYFSPDTIEFGKQQLGIDGFRFYFLGRGGVLGDVDADVVRCAFGYFEPGLLRKMWESAIERSSIGPRDTARAYLACAHDFGRARFGGLPGLDAFVEAATQVIGAVEGASLPLFVAARAEPVPADAPAAAMHQAVVLRELRGSAHLLALAASGLDSSVAHAVKRPTELELFGYTADTAPPVTDADRAAWRRAEQLTDDLLAPAYATLTAAQAEALIAGTRAMAGALGDQ
jgi:hypothetical protein